MLKEALQTASVADSRTERADRVFDFAVSWLFSSPMRELLALFGEAMPERGVDISDEESTSDWLHLNEELPAWLNEVLRADAELTGGLRPHHVDVLRRTLAIERMTADDFDFRGRGSGRYRERAQAVSVDFNDDLRAAILDCTRRLGLVDADKPQHRQYDMTLVLAPHRRPTMTTPWPRRSRRPMLRARSCGNSSIPIRRRRNGLTLPDGRSLPNSVAAGPALCPPAAGDITSTTTFPFHMRPTGKPPSPRGTRMAQGGTWAIGQSQPA